MILNQNWYQKSIIFAYYFFNLVVWNIFKIDLSVKSLSSPDVIKYLHLIKENCVFKINKQVSFPFGAV